MANEQDDDMYLFNGDMGQTPNAFTGQTFDSFLDATAAQNDDAMNLEFLNPGDLVIKKEHTTSPKTHPTYARTPTSSTSSSNSSDFPPHHNRNVSTATTTSPAMSKSGTWGTGINGMPMPMHEQYLENGSMSGMDQDLDQQMASAFDFETAASTPSGFDSATMNTGKHIVGNPQMRRTGNMMGMNNNRNPSPRMTAAPASFFLGSREASPLSSMLPVSQAPSPWTKHSPSSGLEETFNHMGMNGDSPGNATFPPNMQMGYSDAQFSFAPDSNGTPSSFTKDISSPSSTMHSLDGQPVLHIQPTSLKSRVETQIPIRMTLYPLPAGIRKLRLPTHTVSKPKFLAKSESERSPDTLELSVSLVCTSAMQDPHRKQRALARARGEDVSAYSRPSPASSNGSTPSKEDDEKPLNGGEVKICSGCIQRERKRASRKKQKKPEEEELFQKDEEKRVVVFNTNEVKEWAEVTKETQPANDQSPLPPPGTTQVELPMRIACYCRHQNEKMGFQVIFTIKDFRGKVIAQAMTNSIMITDDHKTHNAPQPLSATQATQMPQPPHFPGAGVFTAGAEMPADEANGAKLFKQSYSTPDLTRLQHFNGQFSGPNNPFAVPQAMSGNTSATLTPRNLSRPASPSGPSGPATKRRKPSGSGKLPSGLTMTRLETTQPQAPGPATMPNTAASSPYTSNMPNFMAGPDQHNFQPALHPRQFNSPPTPGGDGTFGSINRSFSLENMPRQALMSAPSSRQPSRPGSPMAGAQHNYVNDATFPQGVNQQLMGQSTRRPMPVIHKLVPAEGSTSGGTEVTLLGNGFYQGLEVMFGDTEATATTFWGEKCLNCIAPPAVQPGMVSVIFKHEHAHYSSLQATSHVRHAVYNYIDDRELEMLRLALRTIGKQMGMGTDDPQAAAQMLLQQNQASSNGMPHQHGPYGGMSTGHQRVASIVGSQHFAPQEMELCLLRMLGLARRQIGSSPVRLDLRRPTGLTLLHYAASLDMPRFVTALLAAGAEVNALDNNGFTPMHHAALSGHEEVIDQLRLGGADHRLRSLRNFVPADLATTLQAYQATMRPYHHSRSRSSGASTLGPSSRNQSSRSLSSFWENSSVPFTESEPEITDEDIPIGDSVRSTPSTNRLPFAQPMPRSTQPSRRGSGNEMPNSQAVVHTSKRSSGQLASPSTLINAWRQLVNMTQAQQAQLAEQMQHFQESMPALLQLPQLDYQNNGMMRRMSTFFPQRPTSPPPLTGKNDRSSSPDSTAPPSYDELYPGASSTYATDKKAVSAMQAAVDAAIDQHFVQQENTTASVKPQTILVAPTNEPEEGKRVSISQDYKLLLFWIPLLLLLVSLTTPNTPVSRLASAVAERYITPRKVPVA
ncbi:SPT3 Dosage dependent suppressor of Ty-induced promoter mutations-like protein [Exophiala xenobiotica]|uniref:SPT3 Dosage dependent suppressor of Ty-induced promoter mutations-like protein n=1 Tax=Lithohypha guttulata TaxID=1690604 RepID=A0ABR0KFW7_9EURO|nr:SPT3 Dosage dependent suppressor of Ty-induced promoter mutations-like protein [Lithohypha guttulata]KAK5322916.1 SPT3 Dosage dependent suppressor of Ty-induced promoter mutations-like protein [Exophiala xenobiotica]